ncbi:tRNA (N6-isopentenyl adenosine(37)-C2)-methylthiotransferase MiaB [Oscillospiraceae bacterium MB08-C2-2]|nr:tRNA (N6-isopentenyl adenosine(37)-C2)-methylthiotransferase MiaB [Oscillospiraceae bacterium MB08-C2-2]
MNTQSTMTMPAETQKFIELVRLYNIEFEEKTGRPPVCHTHSYGCQQNVSDGERLAGMLAEMGYSFTDDRNEADFILYNTCAIRENAEDRIFGNVGALKHNKRRNPGMVVGLCGCMMQQEHVVEKIQKSFPYVDLVFGTHALHHMPELLYTRLSRGGRVFDTAADSGEGIVEGLPARRDSAIKAWLPIMKGCNNFCTYCVVPYVRGREKSRPAQMVLEEARSLVEAGYKEITLLGQNVNSYGKDLESPIGFAQLLYKMNEIPGDFRIRFMTSHPKDCTRELIDAIAACDKVCNHIHLPVQSGSDRILEQMNRHYNRQSYLELVRYARERIPGVTFTSDIIVGFPGETYSDFQETLSLIREVKYLSLFTFLYSPRVGTKAAAMEDPVPAGEKSKWFRELLTVQSDIGNSLLEKMVGSVVEVLVEGMGKTGEDYSTGKTASSVSVDFIGSEQLVGQIVKVRITQALSWALMGELV